MISLVMPHLKQELILEPAQVPVDSADSRVAAMAAIRNFILTVKIWTIFLVISSEICSTAITAKAAVSAAMAHMSISPVTVAAFTVDLAEVAFTVATASADSISRIFRKKALM